jgi:hypothetical protein
MNDTKELTCYNCGKKLKGRQKKYCSKNCTIKFRSCLNCGKRLVKDHFRCSIYSYLAETDTSEVITIQNLNTKTDHLLDKLWFSRHIRLLCCTCMKFPNIKDNLEYAFLVNQMRIK